MSNRLPVPPELEHLIEKRERERDRRDQEQRSGADQRMESVGPLGAVDAATDGDDASAAERRRGKNRRADKDRRRKHRRKSDG